MENDINSSNTGVGNSDNAGHQKIKYLRTNPQQPGTPSHYFFFVFEYHNEKILLKNFRISVLAYYE